MIPTFKDEKSLLEWATDRIKESAPVERRQQVYAAQCLAMDNGQQHIRHLGTTDRGLQKFIYEYNQTAREPAPVTMNRITSQRIRTAAKTNPQRFEVVSVPPVGIANPSMIAAATAWQAATNMMLEDTAMVETCQVANNERCIDALHGFGMRITKWAHENGVPDARLEPFEFDGHRLSLDPSNRSPRLCDHEWVIYSEVLTKTKAISIYGDALKGIRDDDLSTIQTLMPTEMAFNTLSGGTLYSDVAQHAKSLGLVVRTVWLKGPTNRFDRMYVIIDTRANKSDAGDRAINFDNPANPYGGDGMPIGVLTGYKRGASRQPISDVGLMTDDQKKGNQVASILFNAYWNWVNQVWLVDRTWVHDGRGLTDDEILDRIETGILTGVGNPNAKSPQLATTPQPPSSLLADLEYFQGQLRQGVFSSDTHVGKTKTHVPASTTQLAFAEAEAPLQDREEADIKEYTRVIRTAAATVVSLVQQKSTYLVNMLADGGMSIDQIALLLQADPIKPPSMRLTQNALRRQTRSEKVEQVLGLLERGAFDPAQLPQFYAGIDMPLTELDRAAKEYAETMVSKVYTGEYYDPIPMGAQVGFVLDALRMGMMQSGNDPQVRERLLGAYQAQLSIDGLDEPQDEQPEPAGPEEADLQTIVGGR